MAKVKIQGHASGTGVLTVTAPNTSTDRTITLPDSTGTLATTADTGVAGITSSADATAITIDSSERVGIGAAPASGVAMTITKDGTGADMAGIRFIDSNSGNAQQIYNYQGNLYFRDATAGVTRIRVDSDGLKFGNDSAAANALDDYEEGTWTPSLGANSGRSGTWSSTLGIYTKIGNIVHLYFGITGSAMYFTSELGYQNITGLPFTAANPTGYSNYSGSWSGDAVTRSSGGHVYLHTTNIYMHARNESPSSTGVSGIGGYISYRTNS